MGSLVTEWFRDKRTDERDTRTRRAEFQRTTLLETQDVIYALARAAGAMHYRQLSWLNGREEAPPDLSEWEPDRRDASIRLAVLAERIDDDEAREAVKIFRTESDLTLMQHRLAEAVAGVQSAMAAQKAANERIGVLLRGI